MTLRIRAYYSNIQTRCWLHWLTAGKLKEKQSQQVDKHRSRLEFLSVYEEDRVGGKNKGTSLSTKILLPSLPLSWIDKDCLFSSCLPLSLQPDNPFFVLSFPELLCYLCHWVCNNNNNSCPFFQSLREEVILRNGFTLRTPIKILTQEIKYFGTTCLYLSSFRRDTQTQEIRPLTSTSNDISSPIFGSFISLLSLEM